MFDLIHKHNLFDSITDKIVTLMDLDKDAAVKMLLDNVDKVPVSPHIKISNATSKKYKKYLSF